MSRLAGTTVLITGAANGIGAETRSRSITAGTHVSVLDRDARVLEHDASLGPDAMATVADVGLLYVGPVNTEAGRPAMADSVMAPRHRADRPTEAQVGHGVDHG